MSAIEQTPEGLRLKIILQPKASKDQIVGLHDDELKITISAPPVDGQANTHLLKFLSKAFKVPIPILRYPIPHFIKQNMPQSAVKI
ncbi:MAG: DUF167 family protein [Haemophilus parainfluenzae]|nr:DUF167 family protein [Haemophilus parainfluenzae]